MPFIEITKGKEQREINEKIKQKVETKKINERVNNQVKQETPKLLNVFKDIKYTKDTTKESDAIKEEIKCIEAEKERIELHEKLYKEVVNAAVASKEGAMFKKHIYGLLAIPKKNIVEKEIFTRNLRNNDAIGEYIDENLIVGLCNRLNKNVKFALHYALEYNNASNEFQQLCFNYAHSQNAINQPAAKQEEIKQDKKEENIDHGEDEVPPLKKQVKEEEEEEEEI